MIKNKYKQILGIVFITFFAQNVFAKTNNTHAYCTRSDFLYELQTEFETECSEERNAELIGTILMKRESQSFNENQFDKLNQDNQSNPNFVAQKAIQDLRSYRTCLNDICYTVFEECTQINEQKNASVVQKNQQWCRQKEEELFEIAKTETLYTVNENFARKERSLKKQKFIALTTRFQNYFQYWMAEKVVPQLQNFANKVPVFILYPF